MRLLGRALRPVRGSSGHALGFAIAFVSVLAAQYLELFVSTIHISELECAPIVAMYLATVVRGR